MNLKNTKNLIIGGLMAFFFITGFILLPTTNANAFNFGKDSGINVTANQAGYDVETTTSLESIISSIIFTLLGLLGVIFLAMIIYGGFTWMTAQGNEEKVKKANGIVMSSLFGLIITLAAYAISYLAISYFW